MKKTVLLALAVFVLVLVTGNAEGGNVNTAWDYGKIVSGDRYRDYRDLYAWYAPNYDTYVETSLGKAINTVNEARRNLDGYYYTKNLVVLDTGASRLKVIALEDLRHLEQIGEFNSAGKQGLSINYNIELKQPEPFSIITVWYRGLSRTETDMPGFEPKKACGTFLDKYEVTGTFDAKAAAEAERQKPRFSPEGKEYLKKTLTQAVGEAKNPANKGKTLFFESLVILRKGVLTGQLRVSERTSEGITIMEYYGEPHTIYDDSLSSLLNVRTILYRVEISNIGYARYVIDSIRE